MIGGTERQVLSWYDKHQSVSLFYAFAHLGRVFKIVSKSCMPFFESMPTRPELKNGGQNDNHGVIINGNVIASAG